MNARAKGKRGEYQVRDILQAEVEAIYTMAGKPVPELMRNLEQVRGGGADLVGLDWLALEVKYRESDQVSQWWEQTVSQAKPGQEPVLFYRPNQTPWRVRMYGYLIVPGTGGRIKTPVDIYLEAFLVYFRGRLYRELTGKDLP